jgi:hypothetical protein
MPDNAHIVLFSFQLYVQHMYNCKYVQFIVHVILQPVLRYVLFEMFQIRIRINHKKILIRIRIRNADPDPGFFIFTNIYVFSSVF